jgi:hypothetical protein
MTGAAIIENGIDHESLSQNVNVKALNLAPISQTGADSIPCQITSRAPGPLSPLRWIAAIVFTKCMRISSAKK